MSLRLKACQNGPPTDAYTLLSRTKAVPIGEASFPSLIFLDALILSFPALVVPYWLAAPIRLEHVASASLAIACVGIANHAMNLHTREILSTTLLIAKLLAALALSNMMFSIFCYMFRFAWGDPVVFAAASIIAYPMMGFSRVIFSRRSSFRRCPTSARLPVSRADAAARQAIASSGTARAVKRAADVLGAGMLVLGLAPLMAIVALLVRMEDGGPALFRQSRVGLNGRPFDMLKFRSMCVNAESDGVARFTKERDERVSRIGRIIRRHRIDELPQLFNVLSGEMSLVGPRPERPTIVREVIARAAQYEVRHLVVPGMTGWAQINFPYGDSLDDVIAAAEYDLYYIAHRSLLFEFSILLRTTYVVLFGVGAR